MKTISEPKKITEAEYRKIPLNSSSSLKDFSTDRKKFYKTYILKEPRKEMDSKAVLLGRVTETLLMEPENFDKSFKLVSTEKAPTGMMLDFINALYEYQGENPRATFETACKHAYIESGYKISFEKVLENFVKVGGSSYLEEITEIRAKGLMPVEIGTVEYAEVLVKTIMTDPKTKPIYSQVSTRTRDVIHQLKVEEFELFGMKMKAMLDTAIADYPTRTVHLFDLKVSWDTEGFFNEYYLKRRAYIQSYIYKKAVESLCQKEDHPWFGFKVKPLKFVVVDSQGFLSPLVYEDDREKEAENGFTFRGRYYDGVKSIIEDMLWHYETDNWRISRENFKNKSISMKEWILKNS